MSVELWDVYSASGEKTGKKIVRGRSSLKSGEYHLVVHIWIISSSGDFLIQKRAESKKLMPGEWAATGGAAVSGEDSFTAASRELFEELGIKSDSKTLQKLFGLKRRNSLLDVYLIKTDVDVSDLRLQEAEVSRAKWVTKDELCKMIENGEYHNYGKDYFKELFEKTDEIRGAMV